MHLEGLPPEFAWPVPSRFPYSATGRRAAGKGSAGMDFKIMITNWPVSWSRRKLQAWQKLFFKAITKKKVVKPLEITYSTLTHV